MSFALVILCGGKSTRMGIDKASLPFGKTNLLQYQIRRFLPFFQKIYLSVPAEGSSGSTSSAHSGIPGVSTSSSHSGNCLQIRDIYPDLGPMGGIYSCLKKTEEDILFFLSVDAPFASPELAAEMVCHAEKSPSFYACTIQDAKGRIQPTFSVYKKECLPFLEDLISKKELKVRFLFDALGKDNHYSIYKSFPTSGQFFNMNDPQAYYCGLQQLALQHPEEFPQNFSENNRETPPSIPVLSFTAQSGTGKTTYLEKLIPLLKKQGLRIAVIKHDAHGFEIDRPGKDSYRLSHAGADHMILTSSDQTAVILQHPGENPGLDSLLHRIENVDLILTEGYKTGSQNKICILRKGIAEHPIGNTENIIAILADFPYTSEKVPVFNLNQPAELVPFIMNYSKRHDFPPFTEQKAGDFFTSGG